VKQSRYHDGLVREVVDRKRGDHIEFSPAMADSEDFAPKEELQSVKDVVYEHAQKIG
jgi:hypothetical protein